MTVALQQAPAAYANLLSGFQASTGGGNASSNGPQVARPPQTGAALAVAPAPASPGAPVTFSPAGSVLNIMV
jgi:hypothetical protein